MGGEWCGRVSLAAPSRSRTVLDTARWNTVASRVHPEFQERGCVRVRAMASEPCPTEETLVAFLAGNLPAEERSSLERHVAGCPSCLEVVGALSSGSPGSQGGEAPAALARGTA